MGLRSVQALAWVVVPVWVVPPVWAAAVE